MVKAILARIALFFWFVSVWILIGYVVNAVCFGGARKPVRYKIAPTNCVLRVDGTNYVVRYMRDLLLNTNIVISCEPREEENDE